MLTGSADRAVRDLLIKHRFTPLPAIRVVVEGPYGASSLQPRQCTEIPLDWIKERDVVAYAEVVAFCLSTSYTLPAVYPYWKHYPRTTGTL